MKQLTYTELGLDLQTLSCSRSRPDRPIFTRTCSDNSARVFTGVHPLLGSWDRNDRCVVISQAHRENKPEYPNLQILRGFVLRRLLPQANAPLSTSVQHLQSRNVNEGYTPSVEGSDFFRVLLDFVRAIGADCL